MKPWHSRLPRRAATRAGLVALTLLFAQFMALPGALAETPDAARVVPVETEGVNARIVYPQVEGLADADVQTRINDAIVEKANIGAHLLTLLRMTEDGWGLDVHYDAYLKNGVLSVLVDAKGQMPNGRDGQLYTAMSFDTETGRELALSDLFSDARAAEAFFEETVFEAFSDDYTGYLDSAALLPFPADAFFIGDAGVTFYYPASQFALFSGYGGACHFFWFELDGLLDYDGFVPARLGVTPPAPLDESAAEKIARACGEGALPGVPLRLGDDMTEAVERFRLLHDPDYYPGGKYYQMESPVFRGVLVMSDALTDGWESSVVKGLLARRVDLFGLRPGETARDAYLSALGAPAASLTLSDADASDYGLPGGVSDYYEYGATTLTLHTGDDGTLHSVQIRR